MTKTRSYSTDFQNLFYKTKVLRTGCGSLKGAVQVMRTKNSGAELGIQSTADAKV